MRTTVISTVLSALLSVTLGAPAFADVPPPDGLKRVPVTTQIDGIQGLEGRTLALVTLRRSEPDEVAVRWDKLTGALDVPSGYMLASRFVAFDDAQLAALGKLALAAEIGPAQARAALAGADDAALAAWMKTTAIPSGLRPKIAAFLRQDGLVASDVLPFLATVDDGAPDTVHARYSVGGIVDGAIALHRVAEKIDDTGSGGCGGCRSAGAPSGALALLLALGLSAWTAASRRRRSA